MALVCCTQWHTSGGAIGTGLAYVSWPGEKIAAAFITYLPVTSNSLAFLGGSASGAGNARRGSPPGSAKIS
jgi:hypothetical protein